MTFFFFFLFFVKIRFAYFCRATAGTGTYVSPVHFAEEHAVNYLSGNITNFLTAHFSS